MQEIADIADVNRVTFYKHYLDVYDLYEKIENDVLVELGLLILQLQELPASECYEKLLTYIGENRSIFKMVYSPNSTGGIMAKFSKLMEGLFRQMQIEDTEAADEVMIDFLSCYRAHGSLSVIGKWVMSDFALPKEKVIEILSKIDSKTAVII